MKRLSLLLLSFLVVSIAHAQLHGNKFRFGLSGGVTNYLGDIRPLKLNDFENFTRLYKRYDTYSEQLSYQVSLEYALGNSVGLMLSAGTYQFGAGDRFVQNDGTLLTEGLNFDRALNFQTDLYDAGLSFVFKPDNDWILSGKSFIAPYFTLGFGVQTFAVYGDLLDADGNRYDYTNPATIPDGTFETQLNDLGTETSNGYRNTTFYANLGLGVRFRITKSLEIFAQSDFKRAATDYLDDVAGEYRTVYDNDFQQYAAKPGTNLVTPENRNRGFDNRNPDWYIYHGMGIKFSFGANKKSFVPPVITQRYTFEPSSLDLQQLREEAAREARQELSPSQGQTNYITVIQLPEKRRYQAADSLSISLDSIDRFAVLEEIEFARRDSAEIQESLESLQFEMSELDQVKGLAMTDSTTSEAVREARLQSLSEQEISMQTQLSSIDSSKQVNTFKLDSLNSLLVMDSQPKAAPDSLDFNQILLYPGQVTRIEYGNSQTTRVLTDSSMTQTSATTSSQTMSREEFDEQMEKFRSEMLQAQATRDSAMMMAFAQKYESTPPAEARQTRAQEDSEEDTEPQEIIINQEALDDKTAKKIQKNNEKARKAEERANKQQEKIEKKNNELLKDALLVGGTAAATAAITSGGKDEVRIDSIYVQPDSLLLARIASDSLLIDSLRRVPPQVDTVQIEKTTTMLLNSSKVEVYFDINARTLTSEEAAKLDQVAAYLNENPNTDVELIGFADNTGSIAYNLKISEDRVKFVADLLESQYGIAKDRIQIEAGGLILRGTKKGSTDKDRKVEIRLMTNTKQ
ncbi:OmpA family protein [Algoriphagus namhaensis]|uniref:OmpA family protein n=1 Tax=Algoriphagus namhaensis TaxID=915353 RepID=A0ABV8AT52_9BACT